MPSVVGCPLCGLMVETPRLNNHFAERHPDYPGERKGKRMNKPVKVERTQIGAIEIFAILALTLAATILMPFFLLFAAITNAWTIARHLVNEVTNE